MTILKQVVDWTNKNSGFISVLIFISTLFLGWVSGIFKNLRKKPDFKIRIMPGPTICCTFLTGKTYNGYDVHRTAISVYLKVTNIGNSPASIEKVNIGYRWHLKKFTFNWFRYTLKWYWIKHMTNTMEDFQYHYEDGEHVKIYPSLMQGTNATGKLAETYLEVGKSTSGVVYFEQDDSWGGFFPKNTNNKTKLCVKVIDSFGGKHKKTFWAPIQSLDEAIKYNPSFGFTFASLRNESQQNEKLT